MHPTPMVSIIIVNYNTFEITCNCIESILLHTKEVPYEVIVVDNASPKDNPDAFLVRFPSIRLIKSPVNGGFAKGNNLGIQAAKGSHVLLLNSDTLLKEDSISKAYAHYIALPRVGALTVRLIYPDGRLQHTGRKFRSISRELLDLARPLLKLLPYRQRAQLMMNQYFRADFDTYTDWVSGAFMLFSQELLQWLPEPKLDERFFMYGEDHLWCYQFHQLGYDSYFYAGTEVIHIHAASTHPEQQLKILKKTIALELDIMAYRKGKGIYYALFYLIFAGKENLRYYIKVLLKKYLNIHLR